MSIESWMHVWRDCGGVDGFPFLLRSKHVKTSDGTLWTKLDHMIWNIPKQSIYGTWNACHILFPRMLLYSKIVRYSDRLMMKQWHLHCNMICRNSPTQNALGASVNLTLTGAKTLKTRRKPGCWAMCNTISRSAGVNVLQIAGWATGERTNYNKVLLL